jgi:hypothetical protein
MKKKMGSAITDILPGLIIGILLLVLIMFTIFILQGKGAEFIERIKNILRGR